ncbi:MAG: phenylacetate--CoA ligase [Planctomycetes bacterium]|nr:phenylacetate--CoA ligase [Planctomycetota bacterium]
MHRIWDPEWECAERSRIEALQMERLAATLRRAYERVPRCREAMRARGVAPDDLRRPEDIAKFPFTTKADMRGGYPYGAFAVPLDDIVRIHASSGTTGDPIVVGYTARDVETWAHLVARIATAGGVARSDIAQIAFGYGLFTGGFGLHYGLERIGATIVPISAGNTARQIKLMRDFGATVLISTPSYALYIAEVAREKGFGPGDLPLRLGLFGGEPSTPAMQAQIDERLGIIATDNYGLSEVMGPGVSGQCLERGGLHIWEDHFLVEIIDPATGVAVPDGEKGELVITTLTKEALPVIRYRTGDLTRIDRSPCPCGRTAARMGKVEGRTDDMLIVRGVNVFPTQIEEVLFGIEGTEPHWQAVVDRRGVLDEIEVWVEVGGELFRDRMRDMVALEERIRGELFAVLGISAKVRLVAPGKIPRTEGKARRVVDRREVYG